MHIRIADKSNSTQSSAVQLSNVTSVTREFVSLHSSAVAHELRGALHIMLHTVKPIFSLYPV